MSQVLLSFGIALATGAAADIYQQCEADGGTGEYPLGERHRLGDSRYCGEPERLVNSGVAARGGLIDS